MRQGLDNQRDLVVQRRDLPHSRRVLRVLSKGHHLGAERVFDCDLDVVDGGRGVLVEVFVDADGEGELDRVHWAGVRADRVGDLGEEYLVSAEDLCMVG